MKLTEKQIEQLYLFTRKHYVEHYDLQTELVDHLANDIEEIWLQTPNLSFEQARDVSFKKFGVFGFMEIVEKKQRQMEKRYWKILWSFAKEWFRLPKIILTLGLFYVLYNTLQHPYGREIILAIFILTTIYVFYKMRKLKKKIRQKPKKWMLEEMLLIQGSNTGFIIATYPMHFMNLTGLFDGGFSTILTSAIIVLVSIMIYVSFEIIPKKAEELLENHYPEYKLLKSM